MEKQIQYHMLLEFHSFLYNLTYYEKEFVKHKDFSKPDKFVKTLIDETFEDLSPIMKSDLQLLFGDTVLVSYLFVAKEVLDSHSNYSEFRMELQKMDAQSYIDTLLRSSNEDEECRNLSEMECVEKLETNLQKLDNGETIIDSYIELKKYPEQTMDRIRNFLDRFYFEYFEKVENQIEDYLKNKKAEHQLIFEKDFDFFQKQIIKVSFDDLFKDRKVDYQFLIGYLNTGKQFYYRYGDKIYCYYNYLFEQLLDPEYHNKQAMEFFKTLADETRLKMLRLMTKKSWYSSEMADELSINKATVSYHMKQFSRFNIIDISLGKNKRIYYSANKEKLKDFYDRFIESL